MNSRAQGIIEYATIVGVVVVVGLASVGVVGNISDSASGVSESSAKATWKNALPFSITDWSMDNTGKMIIALKNNSYERLSFNRFNLTTNIGADFNRTVKANISPGGTYNIVIRPAQFTSGCAAGKKYYFPKAGITIDYNTKSLNNRVQYGPVDLVGSCS